MRRLLVLVFTLALILALSLTTVSHADEIDDLQKQIDELNKAKQMSIAATKPLEGQLASLKAQLDRIKINLALLTQKIAQREQSILAREEKVAKEQVLLEARVRSYYIRSFYTNPWIVILSSQSSGSIFRDLSYRLAASQEDQKIITSVTGEIQDLLLQKQKLEKDKATLASLQLQVDTSAKFLDGEIAKAKAYQQDLSIKIATLTAQQQQLIAQKLASLNLPRSAYTSLTGCIDDRTVDPGFSPRFAFFTYGVPNRVGMNQYGAKGRAESGQNYSDILHAYFDNIQFSSTDTGKTITVSGTNDYGQNFNNQTMNIEDYLKHVYEMPTAWPDQALQAQAIAARTYALYASSKGFVYPNQHDQEVKQEINDGRWQSAVDATKGKIMTYNGQPIAAWYSSTHGGFAFKSGEIGWSDRPWTKHLTDASSSINSFTDLSSSAYDRSSPWFYCDWGSRANYSKTAWLKPDELADILNVINLAQKDSSVVSHLSQVDRPNPDGTETWDAGRVKSELQSRGGPVLNSVSEVTINWDKNGKTTSVSVSGDGGSSTIDGATFKSYFNLRVPANIQIVGPLYNVEKR